MEDVCDGIQAWGAEWIGVSVTEPGPRADLNS